MSEQHDEPKAAESGQDVLDKRLARRDHVKSLFAAAITLFVAFLAGIQAFSQAEKWVLDVYMRIFDDLPERARQVVVVDISADDYAKYFHAQSPLDPDVLGELIERIAKGSPRLVVVDIDTSAPRFMPMAALEWSAPVVWARDVRLMDKGSVVPMRVLGGYEPRAIERSGLAVFYDDSEGGITRRYRRLIPTSQDPELPSLPWKAVMTCCEKQLPASVRPSTDSLTIRFTRDENRRQLPASAVFANDFNWKGRIQDKIVLVGGSYDRDEHNTPLGSRMTGVNVLANVIETELSGGGLPPPRPLGLLLIGFIEGFVFVFLFKEKVPLKLALVASMLLVPLTAVFLVPPSSDVQWVNALLIQGVILIELVFLKVFKRVFIYYEDHTFKLLADIVKKRSMRFLHLVKQKAPGRR